MVLLVDRPTDDDDLRRSMDVGRQVGGVGRLLLFSPPEAETRLAARSLGYRLWPLDGATANERLANAFQQAADLGYEGAVVVPVSATPPAPARITEAAAMLQEHPGVIMADGDGGIALLGFQEPQPTLFHGQEVSGAEDLVNRASQQRVRIVTLGEDSQKAG